jgi:tetratricopeptide (TPR) repeat protein
MARRKKKRLNKKLLIILGVIGIVLISVSGIFAYLYYFKDPWPYIEQARQLKEEARRLEAQDRLQASAVSDPEASYAKLKELMTANSLAKYGEAAQAYASAVDSSGRDLSARITALTELGAMYYANRSYDPAITVWRELLKHDSNNYEAMLNLAEYDYARAQYSISGRRSNTWSQVSDHADGLMRLKPKDPYGHAIKAHALLELVAAGVSSDSASDLDKVEEKLEEALALDANHVLSHYLRSKLVLARANKSEAEGALEKAQAQAEAILRNCMKQNDEDAQAYLNLYREYIYFERIQELIQSLRSSQTETVYTEKTNALRDYVQSILPELDACIDRFSGDGRFYILKAQMLELVLQDAREYDQLIELYKQALACSEIEIFWYVYLAEANRLRGADEFGNAGQVYLEQAYRNLCLGYYHPDFFFISNADPKINLYNNTRVMLMQRLVEVSTGLSQMSTDAAQKQEYLAAAKKLYQEIRDTLGTEMSLSKIAAGDIALVAGNRTEAIKQFYEADRILTNEGRPNARLKQKLFRVLRETENQALALSYAIEMWSLGKRRGRDFVEYVEAVSALPGSRNLTALLEQINRYDDLYSKSYRYRDRIQTVKAQVLLRLDRRVEARAVLEATEGSTDRLELLRAGAYEKVEDRIVAMEKLHAAQPENLEVVRELLGYYLALGRETGTYYQAARTLLGTLSDSVRKQNIDLFRSELVLTEPDPGNIPLARWNEINEESIRATQKGYELQIALGTYFWRLAEQALAGKDRASAEQRWQQAGESYKSAARIRPGSMESIRGQFDIALRTQNWSLAEQLINQMHQKYPVESLLLEGLLKKQRRQWVDAADRLEAYLKEQPISQVGHVALAQSYQALGRLNEALGAARVALDHDRNNLNTRRLMMGLLHLENQQIARRTGLDNLDPKRISEINEHIGRILLFRPEDSEALYYQVIYYPLTLRYQLGQIQASPQLTAEEKSQDLQKISQAQAQLEAVCKKLVEQDRQKIVSWLHWARVNYQYYRGVWEPEEKKKALAKAIEVYQNALAANPTSAEIAGTYASFLRTIDRFDEAEKVLTGLIAQTSGADQHAVRLQLGKMYMLSPLRYSKAQEQFSQILQEDETHLGATLQLAELYVKLNKIDEAQQLYEKYRRHENNPVVLGGEINLLLNAGRLEAAEALVNQMEQAFPREADELLMRGNLDLYKTRYAAAEAYANQMLAKELSESARKNALMLKSRSLYYSGKFSEAEDTLMQLRSMVPSSSNFGRSLLSKVYWAQGDAASAIQELETAWNYEPESPPIQAELIQRLRQTRNWRRLEEKYKKLMELYPRSANVYTEAALAKRYEAGEHYRIKEYSNANASYQQAIAWMERALSLGAPTGDQARSRMQSLMSLYVEVGRSFQTQGQGSRAQKYYQSTLALANKILQQKKDAPGVLLTRSEALYGLGRKAEALQGLARSLQQVGNDINQGMQVIRRATRVGTRDDIIAWAKQQLTARPDWLIVRLLLSDMYEEKGQTSDQIRELERSRELAQGQTILLIIENILAESYIRASRIDEAIQAYKRLLELSPENAMAMNNLAYLLLDKPGQESEAVVLAKRAYTLFPDNANFMDTYAVTLLRQQKEDSYKEAELLLRRALQQNQRIGANIPAGFYVHLGEALLGQGRHTEARFQLVLAEERLQAGYTFEDIKALQAKIQELKAKLDSVR